MRQLGRCANLPWPKPKALSRGPLSFSSIESKPEYLLTIFCVITVSSSTTYKCPKINLRSSELMPLCHMFLEAINQKCSFTWSFIIPGKDFNINLYYRTVNSIEYGATQNSKIYLYTTTIGLKCFLMHHRGANSFINQKETSVLD